MEKILCPCGCGGEAVWLISGYSPEGEYKDEPACDGSAQYIQWCAAECGCAFSKVKI